MYERDYILSLIQALGKALSRALEKKKEEDPRAALELLEPWLNEPPALDHASYSDLSLMAQAATLAAELHSSLGDISLAISRYTTALELMDMAQQRFPLHFSLVQHRLRLSVGEELEALQALR